ncbi:MAG: efflux RND transporter periplasmic adaptor subunit, partial [Hyphomonadaceae bacterium]
MQHVERPEPGRQARPAAPLRRHFFLAAALGFVALLAALAGLRLAGSALFGADKAAAAAAARVTPVHVVRVTERRFVDRIEALGVAKGRQSVNLTANTAELVTRVRFRDGQMVRAGDVLLDLKAHEQSADLAEARAALEVAEANYQRYGRLAEQGFLSPAALDQYRAAYREAQAGVAAAASRAQDRVIRAPFAGRVG